MSIFIIKDLLTQLERQGVFTAEKKADYIEWFGHNIIDITSDFIRKHNIGESYFIKAMNRVFQVDLFEPLLSKWLIGYFSKLFDMLDESSALVLADNPLNRFGAEKYYARFKNLPHIKWIKEPNLYNRLLNILILFAGTVCHSLNNGLRIPWRRKRYKVMREAIWGLYDRGGYYFHDDFLVDGEKIRKEDIILFSRNILSETGRVRAYSDAKKSSYVHFNLLTLPLGAGCLFSRIILKYVLLGGGVLIGEIASAHFLLYWSIYVYFVNNGLLYEKIFSHFKIMSELGHNYFSANHIVESIVCRNYGTKYYLMHWSDNSLVINNYLLSFLSCDGFLLWGRAHIQGVENNRCVLIPTGYVFKKFIKETMRNRTMVLSAMGIYSNGKVISFFDETFGKDSEMPENNYIVFWETILKVAQMEKDNTILIKPKVSTYYNMLSDDLKKRYLKILAELSNMKNAYIVDEKKWSFVEVIGVSDIVVSQGMTSSSTIAIICGLEGLYLDQFGYSHRFSNLFKDKIVFCNPDNLIIMIHAIAASKKSPSKDIPERLLREFDEYPDDRGIDLFRDILSSGGRIPLAGGTHRRVGIIVQARMCSTRLPDKAMLPLLRRPVLQRIIERLKDCQSADVIIVATTVKEEDDKIIGLAKGMGVKVFRGSEEDVLSRFYYAAKQNLLDIIVRITSDCPFVDPEILDGMVKDYLSKERLDYLSNTIERAFPRGLDVEVFSFKALERAFNSAKEPYQREHVTPYIYENKEKFSVLNYPAGEDNSSYRLTLDTVEDYELIKAVYNKLYPTKPKFRLSDVVSLIKNSNDPVFLVNAGVKQKELKDNSI